MSDLARRAVPLVAPVLIVAAALILLTDLHPVALFAAGAIVGGQMGRVSGRLGALREHAPHVLPPTERTRP